MEGGGRSSEGREEEGRGREEGREKRMRTSLCVWEGKNRREEGRGRVKRRDKDVCGEKQAGKCCARLCMKKKKWKKTGREEEEREGWMEGKKVDG